MNKVLLTAELGINHNGSVDIAKHLIEKCAAAGCDFVKFQKRTIDLVYTPQELAKPRESPWGTTTREQKLGLEFEKPQYDIIESHCAKNSICWFASPWDAESVKFLTQYSPRFIKVASALITDFDLLKEIKATGVPVILSTGMSSQEEVHKTVRFLGDQLEYILACTSTYPTPVGEVNLAFIKTLKAEFPMKKIGFSNHHPGIFFAAASAAMGAEMIEFHVTLDRAMYGSDQAASIEVPGVQKLCDYVHDLDIAMGMGEWTIFESEKAVRAKLRRK